VLKRALEGLVNNPDISNGNLLEDEVLSTIVVHAVNPRSSSVYLEVQEMRRRSRGVTHPRTQCARRELERAVVFGLGLPPRHEARRFREFHRTIVVPGSRRRAK